MKIVVLKGSPRKSGNSSWLADRFIEGATEAGHEVFEFDCTKRQAKGCIGCNSCGMDGSCVQQDDFALLRQWLVETDVILFATPIYYFGVSGQLKSVIDRFYSVNKRIGGKKALLFATMGNPDARVAEATEMMFDKMVSYLGWEDCGRIIASGVWAIGDIQHTDYGQKAYELGKSL